ncbi:MAG: AAA family ATPase [Pirellulales bacterium]|nr:AAA family ATPase [Pirellulales bacterium]
MYQTQWGLAKPPFPSGLNPQLFHEGANQREALARLRFLTNQLRRVGLMLGQPGLGKSLLLRIFAKECRQQGSTVALIDLLGLSTREFLWQLGNELGASVKIEDEPVRLFRQLADRLYENGLQDKLAVFLFDNVDQAGSDLQTFLLRLAQLENASSRAPTLVLAANASQAARLGEALLELVDLRIDLEPWDELDTIGYLQLALVEAGSEQPLFDDRALSKLHQLGQGVPRKINRLANCALMIGSQYTTGQIDAETVQAAHQSLSLPRVSPEM